VGQRGRTGAGFWGVFVQFPRGLQEYQPLGLCQHGRIGQIALDQLVARGGSAQEEAAFATGFNERYRPAIIARLLGELHVAADFTFTSVDNVPAARLGCLDDKAIQQFRRGRLDLLRPRVEQFTTEVEVEQFQVAGRRAREQT